MKIFEFIATRCQHLEEAIPSDFFDAKMSAPAPEEPVAGPAENDAALPEGFFDDPIKDAKARGIEYKVLYCNINPHMCSSSYLLKTKNDKSSNSDDIVAKLWAVFFLLASFPVFV